MKQLLIATGNHGKFEEISSSLAGLSLKLLSLKDINLQIPEEVEDGTSYEKNAYKKAYYCAKKSGMMTLADDSGLVVEALKGELGICTRRWGAGPKASDEEWLDYFLKKMKKEENRTAEFVCCICLVDEQGSIITKSRAETKGTITKMIEAPIKKGVPLSSVFKVDGCNIVHSAMNLEEKNKVSHRGKAMLQIKEFLKEYLLS